MGADSVLARVDKGRDAAVKMLSDLCRIPAVGPDNGGEGEGKKAAFLQRILKGLRLPVERVDAPDPRVPGGKRPNVVARVGKGPRLWFLCHLDIVPPGDRAAWRCDPFEPTLEDGRLYGRGTEDNGQALVSVLTAYRALAEARAKPARPLGFAFVADEETGSAYGVKHLLSKKVFAKSDSFVVPDWGVSGGDEVEVSEKSLLWLRLVVRGRQGHASLPQQAVNALRAGAYLLTLLDASLPKRFPSTNPLFRPRTSTFEPTKKDANVPNVNTIPGEDAFYFDCRILPSYRTRDVVAAVRELADQTERMFRVKAAVDVVNEQSSPPTPEGAPIVKDLLRTLGTVRGVRAKPVGIGGGTLAGPLRTAGFPAAVWSTTDQVGHTVDEYARVDNLLADAKVFAALMAGAA